MTIFKLKTPRKLQFVKMMIFGEKNENFGFSAYPAAADGTTAQLINQAILLRHSTDILSI